MEPFTFCESYLLQPSLASAFVCLFISATFAHLTLLPLLPLLVISPVSISCFFFVPPFLTFYLFFLVLCWRRPSSCLSDSPNPTPTPPLPAPFCICKSLLFASQNFYRFSFCARKGKRYMTGFCLFSVSCVKFGTLIFMLVIFSVSCPDSRILFEFPFSHSFLLLTFFLSNSDNLLCSDGRGAASSGGGARAVWGS